MNIISHKQVHPMRWKRRPVQKPKCIGVDLAAGKGKSVKELLTVEEAAIRIRKRYGRGLAVLAD